MHMWLHIKVSTSKAHTHTRVPFQWINDNEDTYDGQSIYIAYNLYTSAQYLPNTQCGRRCNHECGAKKKR